MENEWKVHKELNINYIIKGKGQPLLFIHGLAGSLNNWDEAYLFFTELGFQVIGLDLPGYGRSSKPRVEFSIPYYAELIKDFIIMLKLKEKPILIGNSMGGHIGVYYAAKYKSRLKALVLVDSSGLNEMNILQELLVKFTFDQNHIGTLLKHMTDLSTLNVFYDSKSPYAKIFVDEQKEMALRSDYPDYCFALEQSTKAMMKYPVKDILTEIHVPVLIIWGENDRLIPSYYASQFHQGLPESELHIINKCGHMPEMETPKEFNQILHQFILGNNLHLKTKRSFFKRLLGRS